MKGNVTVTFAAKEALALLSADLPKSVTSKLVKAFRTSQVVPQGEKASVVGRTRRKKTEQDELPQ